MSRDERTHVVEEAPTLDDEDDAILDAIWNKLGQNDGPSEESER